MTFKRWVAVSITCAVVMAEILTFPAFAHETVPKNAQIQAFLDLQITTSKPSPDSPVPFNQITTSEPSLNSSVPFKQTTTSEPSLNSAVPFKQTTTSKPSPDSPVPFNQITTSQPSPDSPVPFNYLAVARSDSSKGRAPPDKPPDKGFSQVSLTGSDLAGADLRNRSDLQGMSFAGKNLYRTTMRGITLLWADFSQAKMGEADLSQAVLSFGSFTKTDLTEAHMERINIQGADLQGANLTGAHLQGANMQGVNLLWTNLNKADLSGANLSQTNPAWASLKGALYDDKTRFPKDFVPSRHGMIKVESQEQTNIVKINNTGGR